MKIEGTKLSYDRDIERDYWKDAASGIDPEEDPYEGIDMGICGRCRYNECEEPTNRIPCRYYGFRQKPRKKKCKHFMEWTPQ